MLKMTGFMACRFALTSICASTVNIKVTILSLMYIYKKFASALIVACSFGFTGTAVADESYSNMFEVLRSEIIDKLPDIDDATRSSITGAKDTQEWIEAIEKVPEIERLLSSNALDAKLAKYIVLREATPAGFEAFAKRGASQRKLVNTLLSDDQLMRQMVIADGARPIHGRDSNPANYGRAMEIYTTIQKVCPKSEDGIYQRLALAVALEYAEAEEEDGATAPGYVPKFLRRYFHYKKAFDAGELDPNFERLSVWDLRFVVCAPEPDEALTWGREMLRNFRPDHVYTENEGWRYANIVNTDIRYGSLNVKNDRPELFGCQNILMNGGICGRRSFFARYICRAFGIPATARPSSGHGASARWTPQGWVVVLGPRWGQGRTTTRYKNDLDFLATTQARVQPEAFLRVKRAFWIGDFMGESRVYGEHGIRGEIGFWNAVALGTQRQIIDENDAVTLDALGVDLGEANGPTMAEQLAATEIKPEDRQVVFADNGTIQIPAAAFNFKNGEDGNGTAVVMKSFDGGLQVYMPRFFRQQPLLVRGGSWKHEASLCESATRHWKGRRPKTSFFMRGLRLAITPDGDEPAKEMQLELADGVTMDFVYIPPGKFIMGGDREVISKDRVALPDMPRHEVTLTRGFYLGKYEVTQAQYAAVLNKEQGKSAKGPDHPVDGVKPSRALLLCDELSAQTGLEVRLPTEAEWEYAARAGTDTRWFFGDDPAKLGEYAWYKGNAEGKSHPVGQKKPNPWGLYDMYGNIAEFVSDEHQEDYYAQGPKVDPAGPLLGIFSSMTYSLDVSKAGTYEISVKVVTAHYDQSLQIAVNGADTPTTIKLPFTLGKWGETEPVTVRLQQGRNTLHIWRDQAPQYGVAVKSFTLKPIGKN